MIRNDPSHVRRRNHFHFLTVGHGQEVMGRNAQEYAVIHNCVQTFPIHVYRKLFRTDGNRYRDICRSTDGSIFGNSCSIQRLHGHLVFSEGKNLLRPVFPDNRFKNI